MIISLELVVYLYHKNEQIVQNLIELLEYYFDNNNNNQYIHNILHMLDHTIIIIIINTFNVI